MSDRPEVLLHFSEDPTITVFHPHIPATADYREPVVWTITEERSPLYWFPRDCPRITYWANEHTTPTVRESFFGHTGAARVHAMESRWLDRMRTVELFVYRMDPAPFGPLEPGSGFWVSRTTVEPLSVEPVGDLFARHAEADIELRITPTLRPLQAAIRTLLDQPPPPLSFSMVRMRNAHPPDADATP